MKTLHKVIERSLEESLVVEIETFNSKRNGINEKHFVCILDEDHVIDMSGYRHLREDGERNLCDMPYVGIPCSELENAIEWVAKNAWRRGILSDIDSFTIAEMAKKWFVEKYDRKVSISNGAVIAAFVMCGYKIRRNWLDLCDEYSPYVRINPKRDVSIEIK